MKIKTMKVMFVVLAVILVLSCTVGIVALAEGAPASAPAATVTENGEAAAEGDSSIGTKALSAALVVGVAAAFGEIAMGIAIAKSTESMARQPEASGKINSAMMLGLVFIETLMIYALIVAILIIFVL